MLLQSFPNLGSILRFILILVDEAAGWDCHWGLTLTSSRLPSTWTAPEGDRKVLSPWARVCREAFLHRGFC